MKGIYKHMGGLENEQPQAAVSRRTVLRGVTAAGGLLVGAAVLAPASGAVTAPRVYTRQEWSARPPRSPIPIIGRPDHIVIHHTASPNVSDFSLQAAFDVSHWIQDLHMDQNGWIDAGQQLTISRGGYILEGRDRSLAAIGTGQNVMGTHTANHNSHTIGIEHEGIYVSVDVPDELFEASVMTCSWLCQAYDLDPHAAIVGHRDYNTGTQCPGSVFYARLPELRNRVADNI
jgi:N-acetylmuramoyl-L-alanine amidase